MRNIVLKLVDKYGISKFSASTMKTLEPLSVGSYSDLLGGIGTVENLDLALIAKTLMYLHGN